MELRKAVVGVLATAAVLAGWERAEAKSIVLLETNATFTSPNWTYTYSVTLTGGSEINSGTITSPAGGLVAHADGDFFDLIDVRGYVAGSAVASALTTVGGATWNITTPNSGLLPTDGVSVPDNAGILNVDFQYVGTNAGNAGGQSIVAATDTSLGSITLKSIFAPTSSAVVVYGGQDENSSTGLDQSNQGLLFGPTPEPASVGLLGLGALSLLVRRRR